MRNCRKPRLRQAPNARSSTIFALGGGSHIAWKYQAPIRPATLTGYWLLLIAGRREKFTANRKAKRVGRRRGRCHDGTHYPGRADDAESNSERSQNQRQLRPRRPPRCRWSRAGGFIKLSPSVTALPIL